MLSVLALIGGGIAWHERGQAEEQREAASTNEQRAIAQEGLALEQKEAAERNARAAHASQTRAAYLLGVEMLEMGKTREGITSLAQALTLDPEHQGARDRLYSYHLYGLPKAICLLSVEAPEGMRQRISGARRGPVQRVTFLDAHGAPEIRELATRALVAGPWSEERDLFGSVLDETSAYLLCVRNDRTCRVWSVAERRAGPEIATGFENGTIAFSTDGRWLAAGDLAGQVRLWDLADGRLAHEWTLGGAVDALELDLEHGQLVASGGELALFDLATGAERARVSDPDWRFRRVARSADGAVLVALQEQSFGVGTRFVFLSAADATPWPDARTLTPTSEVFDFAPGEDGTRLALAAFSDTAMLWHRQDESLDRGFEHETYPTLVRLTPDARLLVTATSDGTVRIFDAESGALAFEPINSDGRLEDLEVSWDGRYLLTSTARRARLWDLAVGRALTQPLRQDGSVHALRFARDGQTLWVGAPGSGLQAWNARTLELERPALFAGELTFPRRGQRSSTRTARVRRRWPGTAPGCASSTRGPCASSRVRARPWWACFSARTAAGSRRARWGWGRASRTRCCCGTSRRRTRCRAASRTATRCARSPSAPTVAGSRAARAARSRRCGAWPTARRPAIRYSTPPTSCARCSSARTDACSRRSAAIRPCACSTGARRARSRRPSRPAATQPTGVFRRTASCSPWWRPTPRTRRAPSRACSRSARPPSSTSSR